MIIFPIKTRPQKFNSAAGFTIVEAIIAITIFAVLIIVFFLIFIYLTRIYYKNLNQNQAQAIVSRIIKDIKDNIHTSGNKVKFLTPLDKNGVSFQDATNQATWQVLWHGYCIGDTRYAYQLGRQLRVDEPNLDKNQTDQALIVTRSSSVCQTAKPTKTGQDGNQEILSNGMRLIEFSIQEVVKEVDPLTQKPIFGITFIQLK